MDEMPPLTETTPATLAEAKGCKVDREGTRGGGDRVQRSRNRRAPPARRHQIGAGIERRGRGVRSALAGLPAARTIPSMGHVVPAVGGGHSRFRACAEERTEKMFAGRPDQINGPPRRAVLRHEAGEFTIPASVDGKVDDCVFDTGARHSVMTAGRAARLGLKIDATLRALTGSSGQVVSGHRPRSQP
jgi:hypothetical protein